MGCGLHWEIPQERSNHFMHIQQILQYAQDNYGVSPDYPFSKYKNAAVLRHLDNQKWFAILIELPGDKLGLDNKNIYPIMNIKAPTAVIGSLCALPWARPAWHMHKAHWVSVLLHHPSLTQQAARTLLHTSFELTRTRVRKMAQPTLKPPNDLSGV